MRNPASPSRRTVVRGAAWTVPVIAISAAAPGFAVSPCANKSAVLPVTWASAPTTTSQTGTTSNGTTVNVMGAYTATRQGSGSINSQNMTAQAAATTRDSFVLVNNSPTNQSSDAAANYQTVTFAFTQPVFGLTFSIDDIDRGTGYWDHVGLTATPTETPTPTFGGTTTITGDGTTASGWRTTAASGGENLASQAVTVTYANGLVGITTVSLRFWSAVLPATSAVHLLRIRQMSFRTCA